MDEGFWIVSLVNTMKSFLSLSNSSCMVVTLNMHLNNIRSTPGSPWNWRDQLSFSIDYCIGEEKMACLTLQYTKHMHARTHTEIPSKQVTLPSPCQKWSLYDRNACFYCFYCIPYKYKIEQPDTNNTMG